MSTSTTHIWSDAYKGMSADNIKGLILALSSSFFIGSSFIVKKKGLKKAGASGLRAGSGGYSYLYEPLWWVGMITSDTALQSACGVVQVRRFLGSFYLQNYWKHKAKTKRQLLNCGKKHASGSHLSQSAMFHCRSLEGCKLCGLIVGEIANFAAYAFAPAILVTPLGALSIIISAVLAYIILREKLHTFGILGCALCVVGSTTIVLHAPQEREIESVIEVWNLATEPAFLFYAALVIILVFILILHYVPKYGQTHIMVYIGVCSLVGSLSVMSVKAIGIALKLTFSGMNQLVYPQTWLFILVVLVCVLTQMNYLNKDWDRQNATQIITEMCGFVTILSGTFLLHKTKDMADGASLPTSMSGRLSRHGEDDDFDEGIPLRRQDSL
ncbi:hypothetical protein ACFE04_023449 [Oxalis oulophora]